MKNILLFFLCCILLVVPAFATGVSEGDLDGSDVIASTDSEVLVPAAVEDSEILALSVEGDLLGGYYFVADCALGSDLVFYIPVDFAFDCLTLDSSGNVVNMTNSTVYAYCPSYPSYTISASRFGTFTYRTSTSGSYNTYDLAITDISDTNISFLEDTMQRLSDSEILLVIAALIFVFGALFILIRR